MNTLNILGSIASIFSLIMAIYFEVVSGKATNRNAALLVAFAFLGILLASMYFNTDKSAIPTIKQKDTVPASEIKKSVIEWEIFNACDVSGLFLTALHSGQGIATLGKKHGAFFNSDGGILQNPVMMLKQRRRLSTDCFLTITKVSDVQGHSNFTMLIERENK